MESTLATLLTNGLSSSRRDMERVKRLIDVEPQNPALYSILGRLHADRKEYPKACALWTKAIAKYRGGHHLSVATLRELLAETYLQLGRRRTAMRHYELAAHSFRRGRYQKMADIIKDDCRVREACCLAHLGRFVQAKRLLRSVRTGGNGDALADSIEAAIERFPELRSRVAAGGDH